MTILSPLNSMKTVKDAPHCRRSCPMTPPASTVPSPPLENPRRGAKILGALR